MIYQRESFSTIFDEALPLFVSHFEEVGKYSPEFEFNPDVESYCLLEEAGRLFVYTVRSMDKTLVGYCIHHVFNHLHFCNSLQAVQDSIFIAKQHRGIGRSFIEWVDTDLKVNGVKAVYHYVSVNHDYSSALRDLGYHKIESTYLRSLQ